MVGSSKPAVKSRTRDWTQRAASVTATKSLVTPANDTSVLNMGLDGTNDSGSQPHHDSFASSLRADKMTAYISRTSIGRLSGSLNNGPDKILLVTDTIIESRSVTPTDEHAWQPVESTRLGRLAVNEWLKRELLDVSSQCIFTEARDHDKVRVIVVAKDSGHAVTLQSRILKFAKVTGLKKTTKTKDGIIKETIRCTTTQNSSRKAMNESIELILRASTLSLRSFEDLTQTGEVVKVVLFDSALCDNTNEGFKLYLRTRPSADVERSTLHLDLDVVPCVPATSVEQTLADLLGSNTLPQSR